MNREETAIVLQDAILKLKGLARAARGFEAAQVQLINLDRIAQRAGDLWPRFERRIREGTLDFISRRLDPADVVIPCGDGFLIVFADLDVAAAQNRRAELEEELTAYYVGEEGMAEIRARVRHTSLSVSDVAAIAEPPRPAAPSGKAGGLTFAPVWSARANVLACYFHVPVYQESGHSYFGYDPHYRTYGVHESRDFLALDLDILRNVVDAADRHAAGGARSILGLSVHSSTLRRPQSRSTYLKHLLAAPEQIMQRMIVKIAEIEAGVPEGQLIEMVRPLRFIIPQIALEFHHRQRPSASLKALGCALVGFQLPRHDEWITVSEQQAILQGIAAWRSIVKPQGLKLFVDRFANLALLHAAAPMLDFATGDHFWPVVDQPHDVVPAPLPALAGERPALPEAS